MPVSLAFLKGLSYPLIATTSAGSGALLMYFAKPNVDLEKENQKWNEDMQKLQAETDKLKSEAKTVAELWAGRVDNEKRSTDQLVNFNLNIYDAAVTRYANCLDKLFDEISSYAKSAWWGGSLRYTQEQRVSRCGKTPMPDKLTE